MATGIDPDIRDLDGLTPADLAEDCGHSACAQFLQTYKPPEMPELCVSNIKCLVYFRLLNILIPFNPLTT